MSQLKALLTRAKSKCELCSSTDSLKEFEIASTEESALLCDICISQINDPTKNDENHWRCLNDSMWSEHPQVQILAWRQLHALSSFVWANDLLEQIYLDDETLKLAKAGLPAGSLSGPTFDSNGARLEAGDTVTLIKDLVVKGANFTAKRGTLVKKISLTDNPEHIEGKVNGTKIVLVAAFLKKSN